jgi:hypothetical protein
MSQRRSYEVSKRVVVGALTLPAALTESHRRFSLPVFVGSACPFPAQGPVGIGVEPQRRRGRMKIECEQAETGEVLRLVDFNKRATFLVEKVTGE